MAIQSPADGIFNGANASQLAIFAIKCVHKNVRRTYKCDRPNRIGFYTKCTYITRDISNQAVPARRNEQVASIMYSEEGVSVCKVITIPVYLAL